MIRRHVLGVMVIALLAHPAFATVLVPLDLGQLSRQATMIVRGEVTNVATQWTADHRAVETVVTLESESYLKGSLGRRLQVVVPGGRLGRYRSVMVGAPEFAVGQRVILFLGGEPPGIPHLVGLGQGVYRITLRDARAMVSPPPLVPATRGAATPVMRGDVSRHTMPVADFERQVRELIAGGDQ